MNSPLSCFRSPPLLLVSLIVCRPFYEYNLLPQRFQMYLQTRLNSQLQSEILSLDNLLYIFRTLCLDLYPAHQEVLNHTV